MMVDVNTKDFYPEFPTPFKVKRRKLIMNMWRKGKKEDKNAMLQVASNDIDHPLFELSAMIKDLKEVSAVKDVIR